MGSHQVPQKYLQGFGIPPDRTQIWMYDKHDRVWRCLPIKRVAQQPGYFDPQTERELSERVENPAHTVLDLLRAGELPSPTQREVLALYIAVMIKRVPRRRRKGLEIVPEAVSETVEEIRAELDALYQATGLEIWRKRLAELDAVHEKYKREPPDIVLEQIRSPWPGNEVLAMVANMVWRIIPTDGPSWFLTSDNPAHFFEGYGLADPRAELTMPLATDLALHACWQGKSRETHLMDRRTVSQAVVKEINRRQAEGAERFLFAHLRRKWIETLAHRRDPYLSRFQW